jgi:hypothetical protein
MKVFWSWQSHRSSKLCRDIVDALGRALKDGGSVVNVAAIAGYGWRQNRERTRGLVGVQGFSDLDALVAEFGIPAVRATQWAGSRRSMDGSFCLLDFTAL